MFPLFFCSFNSSRMPYTTLPYHILLSHSCMQRNHWLNSLIWKSLCSQSSKLFFCECKTSFFDKKYFFRIFLNKFQYLSYLLTYGKYNVLLMHCTVSNVGNVVLAFVCFNVMFLTLIKKTQKKYSKVKYSSANPLPSLCYHFFRFWLLWSRNIFLFF